MKKLLIIAILLFATPALAEWRFYGGPGAPASETASGPVELATDAETVAGSATDKVTTPANIKAKLGPQTDGGILIGAGQTAAVEATAAGATTEILVGGGAGTPPVWTTATGTGAPVRSTAPVITPGVVTVSSTRNLTAAELGGADIIVTGAYTVSIPTITTTDYQATVIASTANTFCIDVVTGTDLLILNGTAQAAGEKVCSDGTINNSMKIRCPISGKCFINSLVGLAINGGS